MIERAVPALLMAALIAGFGKADAASDAFGLGVLRRDGVILPFANFDGRFWGNDWPSASADLTVPINLSSVPKRWWGPTGPLDAWQASVGGANRTLRVTQPDWVDVHCARRVGLRTDYRAAAGAPSGVQQPYPKDGLVVSPPRPLESIDIISTETPAARPVLAAVREAFNRAERETERRHGHIIERRAREGVEPTVEAIYAFGSSPRYYYVEAVRLYRDRDTLPGECSGMGFGTGWFVGDGDQLKPVLMLVDVLECDRRGASYMLPLGIVRARNKAFWVAQFSGWDHERYVVIELKPKGVDVVLDTWGGGC